MAERRMISKKVLNKPAFLLLTAKARLLYFYLITDADDDGFVENPKPVIYNCGANIKSLEALINNGFILKFESGVIVITHWIMQNKVKNDRYKKTEFQKEFSQLKIDEFGVYHRA